MASARVHPFARVLPGRRLPYFSLRTTTGGRWRTTDLVGRRLILGFVGGVEDVVGRSMLHGLHEVLPALLAHGAAVAAIAPLEVDLNRFAEPRLRLSYPVLVDPNSVVHRLYGAVDWSGLPAASIFLANPGGRVIFRALGGLGETLPSMSDVVAFLQYDCIAPWAR